MSYYQNLYRGGFLGIRPETNFRIPPPGQRLPSYDAGLPDTLVSPLPPAPKEHPAVQSSKRNSMVAVIILGIALIAVMFVEQKHVFSENGAVRFIATYQKHIALVLSILILIIIARHYHIATKYTNWIPFLPSERFGSAPGTACKFNVDCSSNNCGPNKICG